MDSFGVFPSRSRAIRLAIMGFKSRRGNTLLSRRDGLAGRVPGCRLRHRTLQGTCEYRENRCEYRRAEEGVGPTLGLTLIVQQRYTKDSRYWLDGLTDWDPFLEALSHEDIVVPEKLAALADWVSKPTMLFAKSGRFVMCAAFIT